MLYPTADEVIVMHDEAVARSGDPACPLLFPDKLDAALQRPLNAEHYEGADLIRVAVLLAVAISQAQAFLDGNKRAALAAADTLLRVNGMVYIGAPMALARWLESVAESAREERDDATDRFDAWLRAQVRPRA